MLRPRHNPLALARPAGFSLIEVVMVVGIIAIIAGIAVPRYASSVRRYRIDAAAARVGYDLDLARERARSTASTVQVIFSSGLDEYTIMGEASLDPGGSGWEVDLAESPYAVDLFKADFDGSPILEFDAFGDVVTPGVVVVRLADEYRSISVGEAGVDGQSLDVGPGDIIEINGNSITVKPGT